MNNTNKSSETLAEHYRKSGIYSCEALTLHRQLWHQKQTFKNWLAYVIFKRQLGYALSAAHLRIALRWYHQPIWRRLAQGQFGHCRRQLKNLISEAQTSDTQPAVTKHYQQQVSRWRQHQHRWRSELLETLQSSSVAIVGNSPNLAGRGLGGRIDAHDVVVRFNQFASKQTDSNDIGKQLSVWVMAPGYQGTVPEHVDWVIVTGPNMVWWQQNWPQLSTYRGKLISVPLTQWRDCVRQLKAPPSAGFLIAHWLKQVVSEDNFTITGFGVDSHQPYHHALKNHQATHRHNWQKETDIMSSWIEQYGL